MSLLSYLYVMKRQDPLGNWLGEQRAAGWSESLTRKGPALTRTIQTDGIVQAQDYADKAGAIIERLATSVQLSLYINNSGLSMTLYSPDGRAIPESYYLLATKINESVAG